MRIHYAVVASPLGRLLVGATDRGISALYLGESDDALLTALRNEYPRAELLPDARDSGAAARRAFGAGSRRSSRTCADRSLTSICPPTCRPPLSSGASGKSCAAFPTAPRERTPRSRVPSVARRPFAPWREPAPRIRFPWWCRATASCVEDGDLAGYRWGMNRKRALLEKEAAAAGSKGRARKHAVKLPLPQKLSFREQPDFRAVLLMLRGNRAQWRRLRISAPERRSAQSL